MRLAPYEDDDDHYDDDDDDNDQEDDAPTRLKMYRILIQYLYEDAQNSSAVEGSPRGIIRWEKQPPNNNQHREQ